MALANYTDLLAAISAHMHRSDLGSVAPDFVVLAEAKFKRELIQYTMDATASLALAGGGRSVALPSDFLAVKQVATVVTGDIQEILPGNIDYVPVNVEADITGYPQYYRITGSTILFDRISDAAYTITVSYRKKMSLVTEITNWLMTEYPDLYLCGALAEAHRYVKDYQSAAVKDAVVAQYIFDINKLETTNRGRPALDIEFRRQGHFNIFTGDYS